MVGSLYFFPAYVGFLYVVVAGLNTGFAPCNIEYNLSFNFNGKTYVLRHQKIIEAEYLL